MQTNDIELLRRFVVDQDHVAFEALIKRHGPMVLNVCRRKLPNRSDAEDAFQATFIVFVRKAGSMMKHPSVSVAGWLYGVALRVSLKLCAHEARRIEKESEVIPVQQTETPAIEPWNELWPLVDEELKRLPKKYRLPILLCHLEGQTCEKAAEQLGWTADRVKGMLRRGREILKDRLVQRGVTATVGTLAVVLAENASASVPDSLLVSTVETAVGGGANSAGALAGLKLPLNALAQWMLKRLLIEKLLVGTAVVITALGVGAASYIYIKSQETGSPRTEAERHQPSQQARPVPGVRKTINTKASTESWDEKFARMSLEELIREAMEEYGQRKRQQIYDYLGRTYTTADFDRLLIIARRIHPEDTEGFVRSLVREWVPGNPASVAAWAKGLPPGRFRDAAIRSAVLRWVELSPAETAEWVIKDLPYSAMQHSTLYEIVLALVVNDPQAAMEWAERFQPSDIRRSEVITCVTSALADQDSQAAASWLASLDVSEKIRAEAVQPIAAAEKRVATGSTRFNFMDSIHVPEESPESFKKEFKELSERMEVEDTAKSFAENDPIQAMAWAQDLPRGDSRDTAIDAILRQWIDQNSRTAATWILQQTAIESKPLDRSTMRVFTQADPEAGFLLAQEFLQHSHLESGEVKQLAEDWAGTTQWSTVRATDWLNNQTESDFRNETLKAVEAAAKTAFLQRAKEGEDSNTVMVEVLQFPDKKERCDRLKASVVSWALQDWVQQNPLTAVEWVNQQVPPGEERQIMLSRIGVEWVTRDPTAATQWALEKLPPDERQEVVIAMSKRAVESSTSEALKLADSLSEGPDRWDLYKNLGHLIAERFDTDAAMELDALPPGSSRDYAIAGFAWRSTIARGGHPEIGVPWIRKLTNPDILEPTSFFRKENGTSFFEIKDFFKHWHSEDPSGAVQWIQNSLLSTETKAELIGSVAGNAP